MAQKSRLGKGLGALFPPLPGESRESVEHVHDDLNSTKSRKKHSSKSLSHVVNATETKSKSEKSRGREQSLPVDDVSRETSSTGDLRRRAVQSDDENKRSKGKIRKEKRRVNIPALGELTHPSDMFFGGIPNNRDNTKESASTTSHDTAQTKATIGINVEDGLVGPVGKIVSSGEEIETSKARGKIIPAESSTEPAVSEPGQSELAKVQGGYLAELKISDVGPNTHQPRTIFDEDELIELADSIRQVGVLQPIVVRDRFAEQKRKTGGNGTPELNAHPHIEGVSTDTESQKKKSDDRKLLMNRRYELIMGERRWRASQIAGLETIPAIVKTTQDNEMLRDALLENLHRVNLNPLEEAAAYQQMIKEFGLTQAALSQSVSKSRSQIANMLRLLNLPGSVQKQVAAGVLSAGHARALLGLNTPEEMTNLASRIIAEGLSVRSTEEIVALKTTSRPKAISAASRKPNPWEDSPVRRHLENRFETKVAIRGNEKHGRIEIVFSSPEDMKRIVDLLMTEPRGTESGDKGSSDSSDGWV